MCPLCWRHTVSQVGKYVVPLDTLVGKGKTEGSGGREYRGGAWWRWDPRQPSMRRKYLISTWRGWRGEPAGDQTLGEGHSRPGGQPRKALSQKRAYMFWEQHRRNGVRRRVWETKSDVWKQHCGVSQAIVIWSKWYGKLQEGFKKWDTPRYMHPKDLCSAVYNSQAMEAT